MLVGAGAVRLDTRQTTGCSGVCFSSRWNLTNAEAQTKSPPGGDVQSPGIEITGDPNVLHGLLAALDQPDPDFDIVTP